MMSNEMKLCLAIVFTVAVLVHRCSGRSLLIRNGRDVNNGEILTGSHEQEDHLPQNDQNGLPSRDLHLDADSLSPNSDQSQSERLVGISNNQDENQNHSIRAHLDRIHETHRTRINGHLQRPLMNDHMHGEQSHYPQTLDNLEEHHEPDGRIEYENGRLDQNLEGNIGEGDTGENLETRHSGLGNGEQFHEEQQFGQTDFENGEYVMGPRLEQSSSPMISFSSRNETTSANLRNSQQVTVAEDKITVKPSHSRNRSQGRRDLHDNEIGDSGGEVHLLLDASLNNAHVTEEPSGRQRNDSTQIPGQQHEPFLLEPGLGVDTPGNEIFFRNGEHGIVGKETENQGGAISSGGFNSNNSDTRSFEQSLHHGHDNEGPIVHGVTLGHNGIIPHERQPSENVEPEIVLRNPNHTSTAPTVNLHQEQQERVEHENHRSQSDHQGVDIPIDIPKTNYSNEPETVEHGQRHEINPMIIQGATVTPYVTRESPIEILPSTVTHHNQFTEPSINTNQVTSNRTGEISTSNTASGNENNMTVSNTDIDGSNNEQQENLLNRSHEVSENEYINTISDNYCNDSMTADERSALERIEVDYSENGDADSIHKSDSKNRNCKSNLREQHSATRLVSEINLLDSILTSRTVSEPTAWSDTLTLTSSFVQYTPEYIEHGQETHNDMYISNTPLMTTSNYDPTTDYVTAIQKPIKTGRMSSVTMESLGPIQSSSNVYHFQTQTFLLPSETFLPSEIVDESEYMLDLSVTEFLQTTSIISEQSLGDSNIELSQTLTSQIIHNSADFSLESKANSIPIRPSHTIPDRSEISQLSSSMSVPTPGYFTNKSSFVTPQSTETTQVSWDSTLPIFTDSHPEIGTSASSNTAITGRSTAFVPSTSNTPSITSRTSLRVLIVDRSTKLKLPDSTTSSPRVTSKKQGVQKPTDKPNMNTQTSAPSTTQPVFTARHPASLSYLDIPTRDTGLEKTTKDLVITTPPQVFLQIDIRMSTCQFLYQKPNFISELKDLIVTEKQVRIEYEQFVVQIKDVPEEYCKDVPSELAVGEKTVDQITVDMYIVDKKGNIDIRLTYDVSSVISKGFKDSSSAFKDKIVRVDIQRNQDTQFVTKLSNVNILETEEEKASIAMVIVLGSVGGCCCVILVILQVVLIHRRVTSKRKASYLSRRLSVRSMDNVALGVIPKSRPNSGYWNPALADVADLYDTTHSHLMNYSELANFCMEITDIYDEYQTIPCEVPESSVVPFGEEDKNRFAYVLPYKHSRVKLKMGPNYRSDYINANYVTGYRDSKHAYIATQSPLVNTVEDFWRMVWEQQSRVILMLNPVLANGKPKQSPCYWPDNLKTDVRRRYGDFSVTLIKRDVQQDYIECTLELMDLEVNLKREIRHFWFTCWPESSILEPLKLVKFVLDTRPQYENSGAPVVIHCGPGQGRTGALIAVDVCMRRFEDKRRVDILDCVYKMRKERAGVVQNKEQYALIYQALNEYAVLLSSPSLSTRSSIITLHAML